MSLLTSPQTTREQHRFFGKMEREFNRRSFYNSTSMKTQPTTFSLQVRSNRSTTILTKPTNVSLSPCNAFWLSCQLSLVIHATPVSTITSCWMKWSPLTSFHKWLLSFHRTYSSVAAGSRKRMLGWRRRSRRVCSKCANYKGEKRLSPHHHPIFGLIASNLLPTTYMKKPSSSMLASLPHFVTVLCLARR